MILGCGTPKESYSLKSGWSKSVDVLYIPTKMLSPEYSTPFSQLKSARSFCNAFSHSSEFCRLEMFTASRPLSFESAGVRTTFNDSIFLFFAKHCSESFAIVATRNPRATPIFLPLQRLIVEMHSLTSTSSQQLMSTSNSVQ